MKPETLARREAEKAACQKLREERKAEAKALRAELKAALKEQVRLDRLHMRRLHYRAVVNERKRELREQKRAERMAREVLKAQRKAEREAKFQARHFKKKELPKQTREFLQGWNAALEFVKGGGLKQ